MSGLEKEFPGKVKAQNLDATTDASRKAIKELGFKNHGLVVRSADGAVLHKQADHTVDMDQVREAIRGFLKQPG
ncbi:MAG TPA: hypothetical protein VFB49_12820 [Patescibacteria group bacterium]|nr:hypothetical protein [Patescibacteria group bacterium]